MAAGKVYVAEDRAPAREGTSHKEDGLDTDTVEIPVKLCNLPPLNAIANQVVTLTADPDVDLKKLGSVMQCDPAFAADVLFLANSSLFGFPSRIQALRHAIAVLGLERIKSLAITVAMRSFVGKGGPLLRQCWEHSAACAMIAQEISPLFDITTDSAYSLGLLHDIGRLGLLKSYTAEYSTVLNGSYESVDEVLRAERAVLNVDHGLAGAWLVKNWGLPQGFIHTCEHHHDPLGPKDSELLQVIKIACMLADAIGCPAVTYTTPIAYEEIVGSLPQNIARSSFPSGAELQYRVEEASEDLRLRRTGTALAARSRIPQAFVR